MDYIGNPVPTWLHFLRIIPSRWPQQNPISHVQPWLHSIHIPKQHRANIVLDVNDLKWAHYLTFWRATFNYIKENAMKVNPLSEPLPSSSNTNILWTTLLENDEQAREYFWQKKEELDIKGFCILEDFLKDHELPETFENQNLKSVSTQFFINLRKYTLDTFPSEDAIKNTSSRNLWDTIINVGAEEDERRSKKGEGRFTSTHLAITKEMEKKNTVWACRARALLDVRIATAMSALRVHDNQKDDQPHVFTPKTGGRWLITSKGCQRQKVHSDFPTLSAQQLLGRKSPGYFTISTGEKSVPLWVSPESHRIIALEDFTNPLSVNLIHVPPFSIFIGRGDFLHAGAAYKDSPHSDTLLRYHMYFVPSSFSLPDGVFLAHHIKLNFTEEQHLEESEQLSIDQGDIPDDDDADGNKSTTKSTPPPTPKQHTDTSQHQEEIEKEKSMESPTPSSGQAGKQPVDRKDVLQEMEKELQDLGISPPSPTI